MPIPSSLQDLPTQAPIDLSGLRDIHIPIAPSFWPPAIGWWYLAGVILTVLIGMVIWRIHIIHGWRYQAQRVLYHSFILHANAPVLLARDISHVLKRVLRTIHPTAKIGRLAAEQWADFLQKEVPHVFSKEEAKIIAFSTYMPHNRVVTVPASRLYRKTRLWIRRIKKEKKHAHYHRRHS